MNEFNGDQAMAELNHRYYKQRRVKNLLRIHNYKQMQQKVRPVL